MNKKDRNDHPVELPLWLSTKISSQTPFTPQTQLQLAKKVQSEPRLLQAIKTLEENIQPDSKEWGLVMQFCRNASKQLLESHPHFVKANHCKIEHSLLVLGAYAQDYSLSNFFQEYYLRTQPGAANPIASVEEKKTYAEAISIAFRAAAEIQPQVAIAFANSIRRSQLYFDNAKMVEDHFETLAVREPRMVLTMIDRFDGFPNRQKIHDIAQQARANSPVEPITMHSHSEIPRPTIAQLDEAQVQFMEAHRPNDLNITKR